MKFFVLFAFLSILKLSLCQYEVPDALIEVFRPRGLRVSIPDQEGIKLFAFHGQINVEMNGREGGYFSKDILKPKDGRWTFYDAYAQLKVGDILYYWTYVDYFNGINKLGYTKDDQKFIVRELLDKEVTVNIPQVIKPTEETTSSPGCKSSPTTVKNESVCSGKLIFQENFKNLRKKFWKPELKFAGDPDFEFVVYTDKPETLQVHEGHLKIRPQLSESIFGKDFIKSEKPIDLGVNCTGVQGTYECVQKSEAFLILPPVASSQISTKNKWFFKFGRIEIRAKLPKGDWIYPELYLNPVNDQYGPGYSSGQIRIAFLPGNDNLNRNLQGGCILGSSRGGRNYGIKTITKSLGSWTDDFHKFTIIWHPDSITVSVDDVVYGNIYAPKGGFVSETQNLNLDHTDRWHTGTPFAPFDKEMFITLGVGVGGHCFDDRSDGSKPWQNTDAKAQKKFYKALSQWHSTWNDASVLDVDYVKVWAL